MYIYIYIYIHIYICIHICSWSDFLCAQIMDKAQYTVMASRHHWGQAFSTYLCRWEGRSPVRRRRFFFDDFLWIFGEKFLVLKSRILGNTEVQKTGPYVTGRPNNLRPSRREVKNDLSYYLHSIVMGLYAVSDQKLAHPNRALSHKVVMMCISSILVNFFPFRLIPLIRGCHGVHWACKFQKDTFFVLYVEGNSIWSTSKKTGDLSLRQNCVEFNGVEFCNLFREPTGCRKYVKMH